MTEGGNGYTKIIKTLLTAKKWFFSAKEFSQITKVHIRDATRVISELENMHIIELYKSETAKSLMWTLDKRAAEKHMEEQT